MMKLFIFASLIAMCLSAAVQEVKYKGYNQGKQDTYPDNFYLLPEYPKEAKQITQIDFYYQDGYITWMKAIWEKRD